MGSAGASATATDADDDDDLIRRRSIKSVYYLFKKT